MSLVALQAAADDVMDAEFVVSEKRRERDILIVAAANAGHSLRAIGDACMVSHQTVANIIAAQNSAVDVATTTEPIVDRAT